MCALFKIRASRMFIGLWKRHVSAFSEEVGNDCSGKNTFAPSNNIGVKPDTMPRKFQSLHKNLTYPEGSMRKAVMDEKSGKLSVRSAAAKYEVSTSTLHDIIKNKYDGKYGGQTALSSDEEAMIIKSLGLCADWGFPLRSPDIANVVHSYLQRKGEIGKVFKNNKPGKDWLYSLLQRNTELTLKMYENVKRVRAEVTQVILKPYFHNLKISLDGVSDDTIINYDETNFCDDPGSCLVISKRGKRHADRVIDFSKQSTSVMFAITASGKILPPYTVYKAKYLYDPWIEGGVEGARYNCNSSGWFDRPIFEDWFNSTVMPYARRLPGSKVLMGDNLSSHLSVEVIKKCEELNIRFVLLPPNATHLVQPLDVSFFRPIKIEWRKVLSDWKLKNRGNLPKTEFPRMLREMLENMGEERIQSNCKSRFKACGIVPFNPEVVLNKIPSQDRQEASGEIWTEALSNHLEMLRRGNIADKGRSASSSLRGKRRNVQADRSLSVADIIQTVMAEEEDGPKSVESEVDDPEVQTPQPSTSISKTVPEAEILKSNPVPKDFVLVELSVDDAENSSRFYVGQILSIVDLEGDEGCAFKVKFMRKKGEKEIYFVFAPVDDIDTVAFENVIQTLQGKEMRRGRMVFKDVDLMCAQ